MNNKALILDLVEWVAERPRPYAEVMQTWRTSCPRLTIWEDAVDGGLIQRQFTAQGAIVSVTAVGEAFLRTEARGL